MPDIDLQGQVLLHQLQYGEVSAVGDDLVEQILLNLPFFFPQRQIPGLPGRCPVIFIQSPAINEFGFAIDVFVLVSISSILALALSVVQNAVSVIPPLFAHKKHSFP